MFPLLKLSPDPLTLMSWEDAVGVFCQTRALEFLLLAFRVTQHLKKKKKRNRNSAVIFLSSGVIPQAVTFS